MTREQRAREKTKRAKELYLLIGRSWTELAALYKEVVDDSLWDVEFASFAEWCEAVGDQGESQAYKMVRTYRELEKDLPEKVIGQMTLANAQDLIKVPANKRTAEDVEAAMHMPNRQFRERLNKQHPGIALEPTSYKGFPLEASALKVVNQAINMAREQQGFDSDSAAIEYICAQFRMNEGEPAVQVKAAQRLHDAIENSIDPQYPGKPPGDLLWAEVLVADDEMAKIFGFRRRTVRVEELVAVTERER